MEYSEFLKNKVIIAENFGFEPNWLPDNAKPHQKDIVYWGIKGGRRAYFCSFGLGKSVMQLITAVNCINKTNKPFLIACPLAVVGEFKRDNNLINTGFEIKYITDTDTIEQYENKIYLTNYERIRKGDIDPSKFGGVSFDEASIFRNLKTETTQFILQYFKKVEYRFVATATPSPNEFIEILNYAEFLGVASRGHLLTRFFKRNSTKAGDLTLLDTKKKEFWQWVSTWAVFVNKPSDLGYSDEGYNLPEMQLNEHCIDYLPDEPIKNKYGELVMFKTLEGGFKDQAKEKRDSILARVSKAMDIINSTDDNMLIWHHLESERSELEKQLKGKDFKSVFGSQKNSLKEKLLIDFSNGEYKYLVSKPQIAGSGCNFQGYCNRALFIGIDDKFNDFIQAIHRILRYGQKNKVIIDIIFTNAEQKRWANLLRKWEQHKELQKEMTNLVKNYGLNTELIKSQMERQLFENGDKIQIGDVKAYNNDSVILWNDRNEIPDNSQHMIITSIPFGDHYEYSDFYNDMGHNHGNENFFKQMDYLIPNLWRGLKPGRIAAIHVKDRIRYSYQNGTSFTTIDDFSGKTVERFTKEHIKKEIDIIKDNIKEETDEIILKYLKTKLSKKEAEYKDRFYLMGKITVTTDVVAENNQTYRLGHSEKCKDATKMGCGLPEYILLFRKAPTESNNAYADEPVTKTKSDYPVWLWQLDAHAYWRSSGNKHLPVSELLNLDLKHVVRAWRQFEKEGLYDFGDHKKLSKGLDDTGRLSRKFMTLPPVSNNVMVWDDINRTNTLNTKQTNSKKEKHICPLQLDLIERLIELFTKPGETIGEPFGGLFSTAYKAMEMGRKAVICELNSEYYRDGLFYVKSKYEEINMPTLFDVMEMA